MPARRVNPNLVKLHRSYSVSELADCCGVHKNTVRNWQDDGLHPIDQARPVLFRGDSVRDFLRQRNASRRRPCPPGTLFCLRCREPRRPALDMVEFEPLRPASGNLCAICETCDAIMHRSVRSVDLGTVMPDCTIQIRQAPTRLSGRAKPSPNCD